MVCLAPCCKRPIAQWSSIFSIPFLCNDKKFDENNTYQQKCKHYLYTDDAKIFLFQICLALILVHSVLQYYAHS